MDAIEWYASYQHACLSGFSDEWYDTPSSTVFQKATVFQQTHHSNSFKY